MSKIRLLQAAVLLLVLMNAGAIFFFMKGSKHGPPEGPRKIIIEKLHFDEQQVKTYDELIKQHQSGIREQEEALKNTRQALFSMLKQDAYPQKDSLTNRIARLHEEIENIHFEHFKAIKSLCKPDQLPYFNEMASELARYFAPPRPPK